MKKIFIDENEEYGLDYSNAIWSSDEMHQVYHNSKVELSDADFLLEDKKTILIIEYKNANTTRAREARFKTSAFNPMEDIPLLK